jgi:diguanylate cyclase (GGDEF)-like protein/PAS domain S-box-containing protein
VFKNKTPVEPTILIVDDAVLNIKVLSKAIRGMGQLLFATNGGTALSQIYEYKPDVVLLDIEMPGMNGYEVCRAIKNDPLISETAVIFVTSHNDDVSELQALALGGVDFLQKPINAPIVRARVQTHLQLQRKTRELALARRDLDDMVEHLPAFVAYWDADLTNSFCNDTHGRWFGIPAEKMRGLLIQDVLGPINFFTVDKHIEDVLSGENSSFDLTLVRDREEPLFGQASLVCRSIDGVVNGFLLLITDITERKQAEMALYDEKERMRITLSSIGDAVLATDVNGNVTFLNPIAEKMTGWLHEEACGHPIERVMPLQDATDGRISKNPIRLAFSEKRVVGMALDVALRRRDGTLIQVEDSAAPIRDHSGEITGAIIVFHDVSEARAMAIKMTHLANYDALTNLPNRLLWHDRANQAMQAARRKGNHVGLILLDIDNFKVVNDTFSHAIGDQILQQMAIRLGQQLHATDTVSRQGGDEFIVLVPDLDEVRQLADTGGKLLESMTQPFWVDGQRFDLSVSIGISLFPDDSNDQDSLYRHADTAMYRAKQCGKNRLEFFSSDMEQEMLDRHAMEKDLREALELDQFLIYYQAKVDVENDDIVGVEALLRWKNSAGQLIPPGNFIPTAEAMGLIIPIGKMVLLGACQHAKVWSDAGRPVVVSVNVSAVQFEQGNFVDVVAEVLKETGIAAHLVELEITEGVLARDYEQARGTLQALKDLGVSIAIDDFGTGYSSLAYLKRFPIDVLKIDQTFVRDMLTDKSDAAIITAVIHLSHSLGLKLVAEGVETAEQSRALREKGCRVMQGFLYSRPMPYAQMCEVLQLPVPRH